MLSPSLLLFEGVALKFFIHVNIYDTHRLIFQKIKCLIQKYSFFDQHHSPSALELNDIGGVVKIKDLISRLMYPSFGPNLLFFLVAHESRPGSDLQRLVCSWDGR